MTKTFINNLSDLIEIQRASFYRFLQEGLGKELEVLPNPQTGFTIRERALIKKKFKSKSKKETLIKKKIKKKNTNKDLTEKKEKSFSQAKLIEFKSKDLNTSNDITTKIDTEKKLGKDKKKERKKKKLINKNYETHRFSIYLYSSKLKVLGPLKSLKVCLENEKTYSSAIYIEGELIFPLETPGFETFLFPIENLISEKIKFSGVEKLEKFHDFSNFALQKLCVRKSLYLTNIPFLTEDGSFFVNGCERVVVSQIIRSPGIYFKKEYLSKTRTIYTATLISNRGLWTRIYLTESITRVRQNNLLVTELKKLDYSYEDIQDGLKIVEPNYDIFLKIRELPFKRNQSYHLKSDRGSELFLIDFLLILGLSLEEILDGLKYPEKISLKDFFSNSLVFSDSRQAIDTDFLDDLSTKTNLFSYLQEFLSHVKSASFSLGEIGRYRVNKRLGLNLPLSATSLTVYDLLAIIDTLIQLREDNLASDDIDHLKNKQIRGVGELLQNQLRLALYRWRTQKENRWNLTKSTLVAIEFSKKKKEDKKLKRSKSYLIETIKSQFENSYTAYFSVDKELDSKKKKIRISKVATQRKDLIENLKDKKITSILEYLQRAKFAYSLRLIIDNSLREFFLTNPLSQYFDQTNPLAELAQKRRVSVFGPNGLKRDTISAVIRDIHPSQYGKLCPVETPEGENAGLVMSLASFARVHSLGWIETPYFLVENSKILTRKKVFYLNPHQEISFRVAFANNSLNQEGKLTEEYISVKESAYFLEAKPTNVDFSTLSPLQILSIGTILVPFVEHNDANRALMGSNMQRQALPLVSPQNPLVGTGFEVHVALESGLILKSDCQGIVDTASSTFISIRDLTNQRISYSLAKYSASNQETAINQRPIVWPGEKIYAGQIIADGPATSNGELALGRNLLIAYLPWEGYNYEDAIVISESLVTKNLLTSIHICDYETTVNLSRTHFKKLNLAFRAHRKMKTLKSFVNKLEQQVFIETKKGQKKVKKYISSFKRRLRKLRKNLENLLFLNPVIKFEEVIGKEKLTRDLANSNIHSKRNLSETGIVQCGSYVMEGDILVGKVMATEEDSSSYVKLIEAIFSSSPKQEEQSKSTEKSEQNLVKKEEEAFKERELQKITKKLQKLKKEQKEDFLNEVNFQLDHLNKIKNYIISLRDQSVILLIKEIEISRFFDVTKIIYEEIQSFFPSIFCKKIIEKLETRLSHCSELVYRLNFEKARTEKFELKLCKLLKAKLKIYKKLLKRSEAYKRKIAPLPPKIFFKENSFRAPFGCQGRVIDIRILTNRQTKDSFRNSGSNFTVKISVAQTRKIQIGDKLSGRHGNKGVISKILPLQDMPMLPDGTTVDILLNPLGVPSRMNVGQLLECLLGLAAENLGKRFKLRPFDEVFGKEASRVFVNQKLKEASLQSGKDWLYEEDSPGKVYLRDGRTGEYFDNPVAIGKAYILKLIHLVEDKIHARSIGPYAAITEQPLAGKSLNGGQRFGEMEVWALEAYGCSISLQELLTVKSDDIDGRNDMYEALSDGENALKPMPSFSESFLSLLRELNALGLDFQITRANPSYTTLGYSTSSFDTQKFQNTKTTMKKIDIFRVIENKLKLRGMIEEYKGQYLHPYVKYESLLLQRSKKEKEEEKKISDIF